MRYESMRGSVNAADGSFKLIVFSENPIDDCRSPISLDTRLFPAVTMALSVETEVGGLLKLELTQRSFCSPTGMFALPNLVSHVSCAAFAQARLSFRSGLL